jgi:dTDP-4-dehydrorhamnose 3,5-epimerase
MTFEELDMNGVFKITPNVTGDSRGRFARVFCEDEFADHGLPAKWVQMNTSFSAQKGTVRGLHYQRPPYGEVKLVRCSRGQIFDMVLDLRSGSATYGQIRGVFLNADTMDMLYIPQGCAHGFQTLSDNVELLYCHSQTYKPDHEGGVSVLDPTLAIDWPLAITAMSDRDKDHPSLQETRPIDL